MSDSRTLEALLRTATSLVSEGRFAAAEEILDGLHTRPDRDALGPATSLGLPRRLHSARLKLAKARNDPCSRIAWQYHLVPPVEVLGPLFQPDTDHRRRVLEAAAWPVPRVLHQIWIGSEPPETTGPWRAAAERQGWSYRLWRDDDLAEVGAQEDPAFRHMIGRNDLPGAVDVARYHVLAEHGGIYLDCDWLPVGEIRFEDMFPVTGLSAMAEETPRLTGTGSPFLNNSVIAAPPRHPIFEMLLAALPEAVRRLPKGPAWWVTGPLAFTLAARAGPVCLLDAGLSAGMLTGPRDRIDAAIAALAAGSGPAAIVGWKPWDPT